MANDINTETEYLFNRSYKNDFDVITDEEREALFDRAQQQIIDFGWDKTIESWKQYLFTRCDTPESVINFANIFWCYDGCQSVMPDPYVFLGYMYYRINMNTAKYDAMDILDSIATKILPKAGYDEADLVKNPYYTPENDERLIKEVESFKNKENT